MKARLNPWQQIKQYKIENTGNLGREGSWVLYPHRPHRPQEKRSDLD